MRNTKLLRCGVGMSVAVASTFLCGCGGQTSPDPNPEPRDVPPSDVSGWVVGSQVGGYGTIVKTVDGGATWKRQGSAAELPDAIIGTVVALDAEHAWFSAPTMAIFTDDGGAHFTQHAFPKGTPAMEKLYAPSADVIWAVGYDATVVVSSDGGENWTSSQVANETSEPPVDPTQIQLQGIFALDATHAWAAGGNTKEQKGDAQIWWTDDGGKTWTSQYSGGFKIFETVRGVPGCTVETLDTCQVWAGAGGNLIVMTTNGSTWVVQQKATPQFGDVNGLSVVDSKTAYAAWDFGLLVTTDGKTWVPKSPKPEGTYMLDAATTSPKDLWVVGTGGAFAHSTDGGDSWVQPPPALPVAPDLLLGIDFTD